ncbi:hypothetical protein XELAEV_18036323mg, partial [Xenopus laevis]
QAEGDRASTSHDALSRDTASTDTNTNPPAEGSKPAEKKPHNLPTRSSSSSSSHQKPSHSLVQSTHSTGAVDVHPSVFGRTGSSISAMTVPIRLDALSYLLNNAIIGAYRMLPQNPYYGGSCLPSTCPYQTGYSPCMNQSRCFTSCSNLSGSCQPGYMPCLNQEGNQPYPPYPSCFMQASSSGKVGLNNSSFVNCSAQSGITWNPNGTSSGQSNNSHQQPEVHNIGKSNDRFFNLANYSGQSNINANRSEGNSWNKRPSDRFSDSANDTPEGERQTFPPQKSFGRFGDKQEGDGWPGRQQREFGRGGGRGRDDFGMRSWQNTSRNQDRESRFGDRKDFTHRRDQDSPERFQGRGQNFKRGRWSNSRETGGETRASWQQRTENRVNDTSPWSDIATKEKQSSLFGETKQTDKDEDWETEYPEEKPHSKSSDQNSANVDTVMEHSVTEEWEIKHESPEATESSENVTSVSASLTNEEEPSSSKEMEEENGGTTIKIMRGSSKVEEDADAKSEQIEVEIATGQDHLPSDSLSSTSVHPEEKKPFVLETPGSNPGASGTDIYTLLVSVPDEDNKEIVLEFIDATNG